MRTLEALLAEMKTRKDVGLLPASAGLTMGGARRARPVQEVKVVCEAKGVPVKDATGKDRKKEELVKELEKKLRLEEPAKKQ